MLARRRKPKLKETPRVSYPRHRAYVRKHECIVPGCKGEPIEAAHVRKGLPRNTPSWARGGIGKKPVDAFCFSACRSHHALQHMLGEETFARKYGVNLLKEALDLARNSPCEEVRKFLKEYGL